MSNQIETKIRVTLDSAQTVQGLNALRQIDAFEKLKASAQETSSRMFQLRRTVDGLREAYAGLAEDDPNRKIIGKSLADAEKDLKRTTAQFEKFKEQVGESRKALQAVGVDVANLANSKIRIQMTVEGMQELERIRRAQAEILARNAAARGTAFEALGLRSIGTVRAEIASVNAALVTLRTQGAAPAELARATEAARSRLAALNAELRGTGAAADAGMGNVTARLAGIVSAAVAARAALEAVRSVVDSGLAGQQQQSLTGLGNGGDVEASARAMAFAREEADRLGLSLKVSSTEFAKLNAAAAGTELGVGQVQDIFSGVAEYATVARLSAGDFGGVMLAVSQILSKGTVSAEELRGQLGERLPGAFQIAAKAMGLTTAELGKMLESGDLLASDFLPKFAEGLRAAASGGLEAATNGTQAQLARLENQFEAFKQRIAQSGVLDALSAELTRFLAQIDQMAASGELETLAKQIAEMMAGAIEAMATIARAAVAVRGEIALIAQGLLALGTGASVSWAYNLAKGLIAVEAASGPAAAGLGLVSGAMRLIPPLALGIIAIELGKWLLDVAQKAQQSGQSLAEWKTVVERIAQQNQQFQGEYRKSAEELAGLTREELAAYQERIKGAQLFYEARGAQFAKEGKTDLAHQFGEEARLYQEHQKDIKAALNTRLANEKELANNVSAVRKGMLSELNGQLAAEKEALKAANAELQAAIAQRKSIASQFASLKQELSAPLASNEKKAETPLTLTDANAAVGRAEGAATQASRATGQEARDKAQEALSLANQAAGVLRNIKKQEEALPERQRSINEGDLGFMARRLEEAANEAASVEQRLAQANQEQAQSQVSTLEAKIAELSKPIKLDLVTDPDNLDAIRAALEQKLQGIKVQVEAVPVVSGDGASAPSGGQGSGASGSFDVGGFTGYIDKTKVAGVVHGYEYVQPEPRMREPGALSFMELFRRVGMRAIGVWNNGYALGGLVSSAGSLSSRISNLNIPQVSPAAAGAGANLQPINLVFPGFGEFQVHAKPDIEAEIIRVFKRQALASGRRP